MLPKCQFFLFFLLLEGLLVIIYETLMILFSLCLRTLCCLLSWLSVLSVLHMSRWGNFIPSQLLVERIIAILIVLISPNSLKHRCFDTSDKSYVKVDRHFTVCSFHKFGPEYDRSLQYIYLTYILSMRLVDNYKDHLLF